MPNDYELPALPSEEIQPQLNKQAEALANLYIHAPDDPDVNKRLAALSGLANMENPEPNAVYTLDVFNRFLESSRQGDGTSIGMPTPGAEPADSQFTGFDPDMTPAQAQALKKEVQSVDPDRLALGGEMAASIFAPQLAAARGPAWLKRLLALRGANKFAPAMKGNLAEAGTSILAGQAARTGAEAISDDVTEQTGTERATNIGIEAGASILPTTVRELYRGGKKIAGGLGKVIEEAGVGQWMAEQMGFFRNSVTGKEQALGKVVGEASEQAAKQKFFDGSTLTKLRDKAGAAKEKAWEYYSTAVEKIDSLRKYFPDLPGAKMDDETFAPLKKVRDKFGEMPLTQEVADEVWKKLEKIQEVLTIYGKENQTQVLKKENLKKIGEIFVGTPQGTPSLKQLADNAKSINQAERTLGAFDAALEAGVMAGDPSKLAKLQAGRDALMTIIHGSDGQPGLRAILKDKMSRMINDTLAAAEAAGKDITGLDRDKIFKALEDYGLYADLELGLERGVVGQLPKLSKHADKSLQSGIRDRSIWTLIDVFDPRTLESKWITENAEAGRKLAAGQTEYFRINPEAAAPSYKSSAQKMVEGAKESVGKNFGWIPGQVADQAIRPAPLVTAQKFGRFNPEYQGTGGVGMLGDAMTSDAEAQAPPPILGIKQRMGELPGPLGPQQPGPGAINPESLTPSALMAGEGPLGAAPPPPPLPRSVEEFFKLPSAAISMSFEDEDLREKILEAQKSTPGVQEKVLAELVAAKPEVFQQNEPEEFQGYGIVYSKGVPKITDELKRVAYSDDLEQEFQRGEISQIQYTKAKSALNADGTVLKLTPKWGEIKEQPVATPKKESERADTTQKTGSEVGPEEVPDYNY